MIILDVICIVVIGLVVWGIVSLVTGSRNRLDGRRKTVVALHSALRTAESRVREIANTTTDPDTRLQASILLNELGTIIESKELS